MSWAMTTAEVLRAMRKIREEKVCVVQQDGCLHLDTKEGLTRCGLVTGKVELHISLKDLLMYEDEGELCTDCFSQEAGLDE